VRPNSSVQKKCCWCGALYNECDMIFGIPKCPVCFRGEKFIYVDRQGNPMPDYKPHKVFDGDADYRNDKDDGCMMATLWFGKPIACTEGCPFKPDCIEWLNSGGLATLTKLLSRRKQIMAAYRLQDSHKPRSIIAKTVNAPQSTVNSWLRRRKDFEPIVKSGDISAILVGVKP
jgi:hypothetical protein